MPTGHVSPRAKCVSLINMKANTVSHAGRNEDRSQRGAAPRSRAGRLAYGLAAVLMLAFLAFEAIKYGWPAVAVILVFMVIPDLALIGGFKADLEPGRLAPRNVTAYNLLHSYWLPLTLMVLSLVPMPELWLRQGLEVFLAGFAWATHIRIDRVAGFGLRTRDGYQR